MILDDTKGARTQQIWNIYYHVFIDTESFDLLQSQAEKLLGFAASLEEWEKSPYGSFLRYCDRKTFVNIIKLWELSAVKRSNQQRYEQVQGLVKGQWNAAKQLRSTKTQAGSLALNGLRAAAPLLREAMTGTSKSYKTYWQSGTCFGDKKAIKKSGIANPMFACLRSGLILHYGTNPLWGFHLSLEHVKLSADSPLHHLSAQISGSALPKELSVALLQFEAWCGALREATTKWTIRFVNSDALALCHVLRHHRANDESRTSHWYRGSWNYAAFVLDTIDYDKGGAAPKSFDVIDTSNLIDHLGSLNVLAAAVPLLSCNSFSILRTEMLLPREADVAASAKTLLSGDLPTMALLLGLKAVQYWTDATATWHINESVVQTFSGTNAIIQALSRHIVLWKPADLEHLQYHVDELATNLYKIYLEMFSDESWARKFELLGIANKDQMLKQIQAYELYSRAGLAVILNLIKQAGVVDWQPFINHLVELILNGRTLNMGPHHVQSLFAHLDIFGLCPLERYHGFQQHLAVGPFCHWPDMPTVVCVTLVVPHVTVSMFDDLLKGNGTPLCHLQLQSSVMGAESIYSDIQLGFGTVTDSGTPYTAGYSISIEDDVKGCKGNSPLIVSAIVSTGSLINEGDPACGVVFGLKNTPSNLVAFGKKLGMMLHLHRSSVGRKDVFVTEYRPNMTGHASVKSTFVSPTNPGKWIATSILQRSMLIHVADEDVTIVVQPRFDTSCVKTIGLQIRYDIKSPVAQKSLQGAAAIKFNLPNPFTLVLKIGNGFCHTFRLPLPLDCARGSTRIARKSLWVEYQAPVATLALLATRPDSVFPVMQDAKSDPVLEHLHYVLPDCLPKLHVGKSNSHAKWLMMCTSIAATMTATELSMQKKASLINITNKPGRLGIKESLYMMFMHVFGLCDRERATIFGVQSALGRIALVIVDAARMDTSNQAVFLDAAVIPIRNENGADVARIVSTVQGHKLVTLMSDDNEIPFWLHLLPTFAERCRTWTHKATCEYKAKGASIPLSTQFLNQSMCTCGTGIFPEGYLKDLKQFKALSKYAVRVAIPVIYASPISPDASTLPSSFKDTAKPKPKPAAPVSTQRPAAAKPRIENLDAKKGACFTCAAKKGKEGPKLLSCGGCNYAQYCSKACQVKDWKEEHKHMCKQLK